MANSHLNKALQILLEPVARYALAGVLTTGIVLGVGIQDGLCDVSAFSWCPISHRTYTQLDYEQIKPNMSLFEARSMLGKGREISRTETMVKIAWENPDGSSIVAIFKDNILVKKLQSGKWASE